MRVVEEEHGDFAMMIIFSRVIIFPSSSLNPLGSLGAPVPDLLFSPDTLVARCRRARVAVFIKRAASDVDVVVVVVGLSLFLFAFIVPSHLFFFFILGKEATSSGRLGSNPLLIYRRTDY